MILKARARSKSTLRILIPYTIVVLFRRSVVFSLEFDSLIALHHLITHEISGQVIIKLHWNATHKHINLSVYIYIYSTWSVRSRAILFAEVPCHLFIPAHREDRESLKHCYVCTRVVLRTLECVIVIVYFLWILVSAIVLKSARTGERFDVQQRRVNSRLKTAYSIAR